MMYEILLVLFEQQLVRNVIVSNMTTYNTKEVVKYFHTVVQTVEEFSQATLLRFPLLSKQFSFSIETLSLDSKVLKICQAAVEARKANSIDHEAAMNRVRSSCIILLITKRPLTIWIV